MKCEYYNERTCTSQGKGCNGTEECRPDKNKDDDFSCYVLWRNESTGVSTELKGCWIGGHHDCRNETSCTRHQQKPAKNLFFCCCKGDMCNREIHYLGLPIHEHYPPEDVKPTTDFSLPPMTPTSNVRVVTILMYTLLPLLGLTIVVTLLYWLYRRKQMTHLKLPTSDPTPHLPPSPYLGFRPIQLIEMKAQGRFGCVWKAQICSEIVAVKVFPMQEKNWWIAEHDVYKLPQMSHENILMFIGAEKRTFDTHTEYWLITAFHEKGSLCDYLKANTLTWSELLRIASSIAKGFRHLHEDLPATKEERYRPAVAHRDFKSKNVLLKHDMTACIADFGLALVLYPGQSLGDAPGQVGTMRYMAPEVLEGAIYFNKEAFLRMDMYAFGLVLWEIVSRCSAQDGPVDNYMLPYEEEVGLNPTLEMMQQVVAESRKRPQIRDQWRKSPGFSSLCVTMEECWDHDAEARLTASCVQERLASLSKLIPPYPE